MAIKLEQLKKAPALKTLAIAVISVIISIIPLKFSKELFLKNTKLRDTIRERARLLERGADTAKLKKSAASEIQRLRQAVESSEANFYANADDIIADINRFADGAKVNLTGIAPLEPLKLKIPDSDDVYVELPINVKLECGFYQLLAFLRELENAQRLILVSEVEIRATPQNIWEHQVDLLLTLPLGPAPAKK